MRRSGTRKSRARRLDVFENEPLPPDHPLWSFKNVLITTHQGGFCDTYVDLAMPILEQNMRCFLDGNPGGWSTSCTPPHNTGHKKPSCLSLAA